MTTSLEPREHEMAAAMLDVIAAARLADDRPRARAVIGAALADVTRDPALALAAAGGLAWMAAAGICGGDDKGTADMVLDQCRRSLVWGMAEGTTSQYEANIGVTVLQLAAPRQSGTSSTAEHGSGLTTAARSTRSTSSWSRPNSSTS